jgi:hypothetical protein
MSVKHTDWRARWLSWVDDWERSAEIAGLGGLVSSLKDAAQPFAPVAAQLLWVAQPTLGLFTEAEAIGALAELLDQPKPAREPGQTAPVPSESDQ